VRQGIVSGMDYTGIQIIDALLGFLDTWGYLIVFAIVLLENIFLVGTLTPGDVVVVAAAFVAAKGDLNVYWVTVAAILGTVIGSNISYYLGARGGREFLLKWGGRFRIISEERLEVAEDYFYIHGSKTVLLGRFASGIKGWIPVLAGVSHMPLAYFEAYTILGAVAYMSLLSVVGWFLGQNLDQALKIVSRLGFVGLALIAALLVFAFVTRSKLAERRAARLDAQADAREATAESAESDAGDGEA